jgi:DNA-binding cell septation regulator SpoVG
MFNYSFNIRRLNSNSALKAFVTVIIDDVMSIEGFKVVNGRNGLFVSVPSHKGTVMEEGKQVEKYFDDVRFIGENGLEVANEIKDAILDAYNNNNSSNHSSSPEQNQTVRANSAAANTAVNYNKPKSNNKRRTALWEDA